MLNYEPETFGKLNAEHYDRLYPMDAEALRMIDRLAELAGGGSVLELAIGTGRVGLALAERGLSVAGVEASAEMIAKLRAKPGGEAIPVVQGDMAEVPIEGSFDLAVLVFNTLFNLTRQEDQVRCFRNTARRLNPGGLFVLEAFVPDVAHFVDRERVRTVGVTFDGAWLEASVHDPVSQVINYQYIALRQGEVRLTPLPMRYVWPSEMDLMAQLAGLELRERWGGWDQRPFDATSTRHVSIYASAPAAGASSAAPEPA